MSSGTGGTEAPAAQKAALVARALCDPSGARRPMSFLGSNHGSRQGFQAAKEGVGGMAAVISWMQRENRSMDALESPAT